MKSNTKILLSVMMFLEFFVWGSWYVTMGTYLANSMQGADLGKAYGTQSLAAIIAPFFIGMIADRYFHAQKILGTLHIIGAILMFFLSRSADFDNFYLLLLIYMICYMPTLALVNSVAFNQMDDPSKQFSNIRVWGTIGWIVAGLVISYVFGWDSEEGIKNGFLKNTFLMTSVAAGLLGIMSFFLPSTPPRGNDGNTSISKILGLDSLSLLKDRNYLLFFISSILICIPLAFYYQHANQFLTEIKLENATGKMTIGQISEVAFMLALPIFFKRFGLKNTILIGMLAWALRYALFSIGHTGEASFLLILGIALHGICYDFFFVSGQIYTDVKAGEKYKSSAQGLITLATYGIGMWIGFMIAGKITNAFATVENLHNWKQIWMYPAGFALLIFIIFFALFKNEEVNYK